MHHRPRGRSKKGRAQPQHGGIPDATPKIVAGDERSLRRPRDKPSPSNEARPSRPPQHHHSGTGEQAPANASPRNERGEHHATDRRPTPGRPLESKTQESRSLPAKPRRTAKKTAHAAIPQQLSGDSSIMTRNRPKFSYRNTTPIHGSIGPSQFIKLEP